MENEENVTKGEKRLLTNGDASDNNSLPTELLH